MKKKQQIIATSIEPHRKMNKPDERILWQS